MPKNLSKNKLVSISQAAEILGVSIDTVRRWDQSGRLTSTRPDGKNRYFSVSDLEAVKLDKPLSISEAAIQLKISPTTLRRLEAKGLLNPERNQAGERLYSKEIIENFLHSEYFLRQKMVEEKVLEPLKNGLETAGPADSQPRDLPTTLASVGPHHGAPRSSSPAGSGGAVNLVPLQHRVLGALIEENREKVGLIQRLGVWGVFGGLGVLGGLIILIAVSFIVNPEATAKFFGYQFRSASNNVLGTSIVVNKVREQQGETVTVGDALQPLSALSLQIVKQVDRSVYDQIVTTGVSSSEILLTNIDADSVQGKVPGTEADNLVFWESRGTIEGLIVTGINMATGSVTGNIIAAGAVLTANLADNSVTTSKVADGAITTAKLVSGFTATPTNDSVTNEKIADGAINDAKISGTAGISDSKLSTITTANKVSGSAVQLSSGGGLTNNTGLSLLTTCTNNQVLAWNGTAWICADAGGGSGTITGVTAGTGLTGGGTSGTVTLAVSGLTVSQFASANISQWTNDAGYVTSASASQWTTSGLNIGYLTGNVGVGNTSPNHKLDVSGNIGLVASGYLNWGSTDSEPGYGFRDSGGTLQFKNSGGSWAAFGSSSATPGGTQGLIQFNNAGAFGGATNFFYDLATGNVGIGTTNPTQKLEVNGTAKATAFSGPLTGNVTGDVTGNVSGNAGTVTNGVYTTGSYSDPTWLTGLTTGRFASANISQWTNNANYITASSTITGLIQSVASGISYITGGNVGIGTTNPAQALDVNGTVKSTGSIIGTLTGILKGASGTVGTATAGVDYQLPLSFTTPLVATGTTITINQATTSTDGYLSSSDWNTFSAKQAALAFASPIVGTGGTVALSAVTGSGTTVVLSDSPTLVGTPLAPTAGLGTSTGQIASTAFVMGQGFVSSSGITSIDGLTGPALTLANSVGSGTTLTINDAAADASTKGIATFVANDFTSSSGSIGLDYANGQVATSGQHGFLSDTDWSTFNNKQDALTFTTGIVGTGTTVTHSTANGYIHIPASGASSQILQYQGTAGTAKWVTLSGDVTTSDGGALTIGANKVLSTMLQATTGTGGTVVLSSSPTIISPDLTGTPTAPTAGLGTSTGQIASTAFVMGQGFVTSSGITSIDGLTGPALTLANSVGSGTTLTINDAAADASTKGIATFVANDFTSSSGSIGLDYANGQVATSGQHGFLSDTDWSTFNNKQDALSFTDGIVGTGTTVTHSTANGYIHIPASGASSQILQYQGTAGTAKWITLSGDVTIADGGALTIGANKVLSTMLQATTGTGGTVVLSSSPTIISPDLTGTPTAPTAGVGTSTGQIATTAFVFGQGFVTSSGITSVNGLTGPALTLANSVGSGTTLTINTADTSTTGLLSSGDWNIFNSKQAVLTFTDGIVGTGTTITHSTANGYIHIPASGASSQLLQYTSAGTAKWITTSGDVTIADGGALTIGANKVLSSMLQATTGSGGTVVLSSSPTIVSPTFSGTTTIGTLTGLLKGATGVVSAATSGTDYIAGGVGSANQIAYFTGSGILAGSNNFWFDGTNVGIGTTLPTQKLEVNGSAKIVNYLSVAGEGAADANTLVHIKQAQTANATSYGLSAYRYQYASTNANAVVGVAGGAGSWDLGANTMTTAMGLYGYVSQGGTGTITNGYSLYLDSPTGSVTNAYNVYAAGSAKSYFGGNVGIGTTAPVSKLAVNASSLFGGDATYTGTIQINDWSNTLAAAGGLEFRTSNWESGYGWRLMTMDNSTTMPLVFQNRNNNATWSNKLTLEQGGNVGIGVTSPLATLTANGTLMVNGVTRADGASIAEIQGAAGAIHLLLEDTSAAAANNLTNLRFTGAGGYRKAQISAGWDAAANTDAYLSFYTRTSGNVTEKLRLTSVGNVGIGTTSPLAKLHVSGSHMLIDNNYFYQANTSAGAATIILGISSDNSTRMLSAASQPIIFRPGDSIEAMRMTTTGNVGIGTTSPNYKLEIDGTTDFGDTATWNNGAAGLVSWSTTGLNRFSIRGNSGYGLSFGSNGTSDRMYMDTAGNVGIGTTDSLTALHIDATGTAYNATQGLAIFQDNGDRQIVIGGLGLFRRDNDTDTADLRMNYLGYNGGTTRFRNFDVYDGKSNLVMRVQGNSGNVGIGTTSPLQKLDVAGNIALNNNLLYLRTGTDASHGMLYSATVDGPEFRGFGGFRWTTGTGGATEVMRITGGNVGIGTTSPVALLHVRGSEVVGVQTDAADGGFSIGANILNIGSPTKMTTTGIVAPETALRIYRAGTSGVKYNASADFKIGTYEVGLAAESSMILSLGEGGSHTPEVNVMTWQGNGNVGIGTTVPGQKLDVVGKIQLSDLTAPGADPMCWDASGASTIGDCTSLRKYKTDISDLNLGLETVIQLEPRTFNWIDGMGDGTLDLGFVAEEMEAISPLLTTHHGANGELTGIRYARLTALLTKAIQEQQLILNDLIAKTSNITVSPDGSLNIPNLKVDKLELSSQSLEASSQYLGVGTQFASLTSNLSALTTDFSLLESTVSAEIAGVSTKVDDLELRIKDLEASTSSASISGQVTVDSLQQESTPSASSNCTLYPETCNLNSTPQNTLLALIMDSIQNVKEFINEIIFKADVTFLGRAIFNKDAGGEAVILAGAKEVEVIFEKEYPATPMINVTLVSEEGKEDEVFWTDFKYVVTKRTPKGFTIKMNVAKSSDLKFNWTAVSVKDPVTALSKPVPENQDYWNQLVQSGVIKEASVAGVQVASTSSANIQGIETSSNNYSLSEPEASRSATVQTLTIKETELGYLRVREEAATTSPEVARLTSGQTLTILDQKPDWYKIEYEPEKYGWISATYVILN